MASLQERRRPGSRWCARRSRRWRRERGSVAAPPDAVLHDHRQRAGHQGEPQRGKAHLRAGRHQHPGQRGDHQDEDEAAAKKGSRGGHLHRFGGEVHGGPPLQAAGPAPGPGNERFGSPSRATEEAAGATGVARDATATRRVLEAPADLHPGATCWSPRMSFSWSRCWAGQPAVPGTWSRSVRTVFAVSALAGSPGDDLHALRAPHPQAELGGPGELLLLEDGPAPDLGCRPQAAKERHAHRIHRHPVHPCNDDTRMGHLARVRPSGDERVDTVEHHQHRGIGGVDLGDHHPLAGRAMQLAHVVVGIAGDGLRRQAHGVLQRQGEVASVAVGLQTAGLDHRAGGEQRPGDGETALPVRRRGPDAAASRPREARRGRAPSPRTDR